jgi:hypothetical protein
MKNQRKKVYFLGEFDMRVLIENNSDSFGKLPYDTDHWNNIHLDSIIYQSLGSVNQMKNIDVNNLPDSMFWRFMKDMESLDIGSLPPDKVVKLEPINTYLGSLNDTDNTYPILRDRQGQVIKMQYKYKSPYGN